MPSIIRGTKAPLLQWFESNFDPSSGFTYNSEYKGFDFDQMVSFGNTFTAAGCTARLRFQAGVALLTLSDATGTVVVDKWEIAVDEERPSIFENPLFLATIAPATDPSGVVSILRNALQNGDPTTTTWSALITPTTPGVAVTALVYAADGADLAKIKQYFDDYNRGNTNFIRGKYRLRHTTNAPARWNANIADFNVEKAYTIAQLLSETQNQTLWVLPLPGYLAYKILNYEPLPPRSNFTFGALKLRSNACTAAYNRVEITTEYIIDQVNTNLYKFI